MAFSRTVGLSFLALCLLAVVLKAFVPLPGVLGYAPVNLGLGPVVQPVEVVIWYGTEKQLWLEDAVKRFAASGNTLGGRPISIKLVGLGSGEIADRVARQDWGADPPPSVVSPASSVWIEVLRSDWGTRNGGTTILSGDPQPLVLTPLVAVAWEERANVLWPGGVKDFWPSLHRALASQNWSAVAQANGFAPGSSEYAQTTKWGQVKFGHTSPLRSNSGAQALILMAYGYHNKATDLTAADVSDPKFQSWLKDMERAVLDFGASTGTFMTSMVQFGPSKYDVVLVYENLAIEHITAAQSRWGQRLKVFYPPATMFSDHPYAILGDPLTTPDQRAAAERFRAFLRSRPIQELALEYGFRPADPSVSVVTGDVNNPFNTYAAFGVQVDIAEQVATPSGETVAALLDLWRREIGPIAARFEGKP